MKMDISSSFEINEGETITFVGAGGKTTAIFKLAEEFSFTGFSAVTTTTKIFVHEGQKADFLLISDDIEDLEKLLSKSPEGKIVTVASVRDGEGKLVGIEPDLVDEISALDTQNILIVEGDGASKKSFKSPADYEPVIPSSSDLVIPVVGMDIIGKTLNSENVHRSGRVSEISRFEIGDEITPELVARVVTHKEGGRKNVPHNSRLIPLLNKVDDEKRKEIAEETAKEILDKTSEVDRVVLGQVIEEDPIVEILER